MVNGTRLSCQHQSSSIFDSQKFAHGFVALEDDCSYKVDNYYSKSHDAGIHCFDEALAITWPEMDVNLSEKDRQLPCLKELCVEELWQPRTG